MDEPLTDAQLRRREFLARTAATAGLAGLATTLPGGTLIAEAARRQARGLPSPRRMPLDHVVVVMMENRSFDHYLGWLPGADGDQTQSFVDPATGQTVATRQASTLEAPWQGCGHPDPGHGWDAGRAQMRGGFLADGSGNDEFALTYYEEGEVEFLHAAASTARCSARRRLGRPRRELDAAAGRVLRRLRDRHAAADHVRRPAVP